MVKLIAMSSIVLKGNYEQLPQPPPDIIQAHNADYGTVGLIALEHVLAGNSSELRAIFHGSLTEDERHIRDIRGEIIADWDDDVKKPSGSQIAEIAKASANTGLVIFDDTQGTVRLETGTQDFIGFSNQLLGVGLESNVALSTILGTNRRTYDWESFPELLHMRRLLICMRIGRANCTGIEIPRLFEVAQLVGPKIQLSNMHTLVNSLEREGHVKVKRSGRRNKVTASASMRDAYESVSSMFARYDMDRDKFISDAADTREHAKRYFPLLYQRELRRTGHSANNKLDPMRKQIEAYLATKPEGATMDELHEVIDPDNNYASKESFASTVGHIAHNLPRTLFTFRPDTPNSSRGVWVLKPTKKLSD